jgi:hypothetical protein
MRVPKKTKNIIFVLFALIVFLAVYQFYVKKDMSDFGVCYRGGQRIVRGETLYRTTDGHLQYKYSPASAVFFSFFTLFPYELAKLIWYLLELVFLFFVLTLCYDLLPRKERPKAFIIIFSFMVMAKFIGREIELGQVNIFILFLLLMMAKAALGREDIQAGLFLGFSLVFKPYALVFLPYFILKKRFKLIALTLSVLAFGFLLPIIFYGLKKNIIVLKEWQKTLSRSTPSLLGHYDNASLYAFFLKNMSGPKGLTVAFIISVAALICFSFLWMMVLAKKKNLEKPEVLELSFLFILIPLFSPLAWYYNYLYSALAVAFLLNSIGKFPLSHRIILIASFFAIGASLREILEKQAFRFYTQHALVVVSYLIILAYLFYSRAKNYS